MKQAQFLMWTKRARHGLGLDHMRLGKNNEDSWEEQAFAEDASGPLGGFIWPPRSYTCSFCKREFRSAQALGGHMNVHRRDRARLKQSGGEILNSDDQQSHVLGHFVPLGLPYSSQANFTTNLSQNPNPNSNEYCPSLNLRPSSKVSTPPSDQGNSAERTLITPFYSPAISNESLIKSSIRESPKSWSDGIGSRYRHIISPINIGEKSLEIAKLQGGGDNKEYPPCKTNSSISLSLFIRPQPDLSEDKKDSLCCKRRRNNESSLLPYFVTNIAVNRNHPLKEACRFSSSPGEDLDLELRLGCQPKV